MPKRVMDKRQAEEVIRARQGTCPTCHGRGEFRGTVELRQGPVEMVQICRTCHGEKVMAWYERDGTRVSATVSDAERAVQTGVGT